MGKILIIARFQGARARGRQWWLSLWDVVVSILVIGVVGVVGGYWAEHQSTVISGYVPPRGGAAGRQEQEQEGQRRGWVNDGP